MRRTFPDDNASSPPSSAACPIFQSGRRRPSVTAAGHTRFGLAAGEQPSERNLVLFHSRCEIVTSQTTDQLQRRRRGWKTSRSRAQNFNGLHKFRVSISFVQLELFDPFPFVRWLKHFDILSLLWLLLKQTGAAGKEGGTTEAVNFVAGSKLHCCARF